MSVKHILHITYDMNIGGTEQVIRNLIEGLNKEAYKSSVLCIDGTVGPWGQELHRLGYEHFSLDRQPGFDLRLIKDIRKLLSQLRVDLVHCHQYTPYTYGWFGSLFTGVPVVFTEHGRFYPDVSSAKRKIINPLLQRFTSAVTAISAATKQALVDFENLDPNRIDVVYNGIADIDTPLIDVAKKKLSLDKNAIVFGTISRLDPIKNQEMMIRAFAKVVSANPNAKLMIVGDGPLRSQLEQLVGALDVKESVLFTGFKTNPVDYMAAMDVFLLPSLSEGTSMTLLEAMRFSKPTIATSVGGTPEIITHEKSGLLIENKDESALVSSMLKLLGSSSLRMSYGAAARREFEQRFVVRAMVREYERIYDKALA